jgi:uncharacterized ferritin-like protein (DUF455 family)
MENVRSAIRNALLTADPISKIKAARQVARDWRLGRLSGDGDVPMPDRPARPAHPELLPPRLMPRRRGGSKQAQVAMLHALAHIEFVAIDLALDMAGRFGADQPAEFTDDFLSVAADEAMHFALLERRLNQLGSHYGAFAAHDGLWEAAESTCDDVLARLAIVPMVLEARGLDVCPFTISRFSALGDATTVRIVTRILDDEVRHVALGAKWFNLLCESRALSPANHWKNLVKSRFRGALKPPFNDSARESAGLTRDYYLPLASRGPDGQ